MPKGVYNRSHNAERYERRYWERVKKTGGCWVWQGKLSDRGYGVMRRYRSQLYAHRYAYELAYGACPHDRDVMHLCDNPPCVNPAHLRLCSHAENMADMKAKGRTTKGWRRVTHCPQGHEYTPENTYQYAKRRCRQCAIDRAKAQYAKRKAKGVVEAPE